MRIITIFNKSLNQTTSDKDNQKQQQQQPLPQQQQQQSLLRQQNYDQNNGYENILLNSNQKKNADMNSLNDTPKTIVTSYRLKLNQFQNKYYDTENKLFQSNNSSINNDNNSFTINQNLNLIDDIDNDIDQQEQFDRHLNEDEKDDGEFDDEVFDEVFNQINDEGKEFDEKLKDQQYNQTTNLKILQQLIEIYTSELTYLNLLKNAFDLYAEPLRKFSSLTSQEHHILFANLEPIVSLSYNLSVKLQKLITNWPCELCTLGKLIGKKFLQSYEEYLMNYPQIIKLLNEKYKQNEFRDFSDIRQLNSNISLKDILSLPLDRVQEYEKSLDSLINATSSYISSRSNSTGSLNSNQFLNLKQNEINHSNLDYWKKMKEKCEKLFMLNHQMHDLDINKLTSLACVQQTFPNDNLNLFENISNKTAILFDEQSTTIDDKTTINKSAPIIKLNNTSNNSINTTTTQSPNIEYNNNYQSATINNRRNTNYNIKFNQNTADTGIAGTNNTSTATATTNSNFVSKQLQNLQRRKTIHDIINIDLIHNFINNQQNADQQQLAAKQSTSNITKLSSSNDLNNSSQLSPSSANTEQNQTKQVNRIITRELIKQGYVTLINQYGKQERYLFLFNDLLIIAKQKNENHNKLKYRIYLTDIWLSDCFDAIYWQYKTDTSFVIGWPTTNNFIADFKDTNTRDIWLNKLKELISIEKQKEENLKAINIKICFNKDNLGSTEPTPFSQCYTKTVQVTINETSQDIVNRCKVLFNLKSTPEQQQQQQQTNDQRNISDYQLWLKTNNNEPLIPLIGHEFPYAIKMHFLRENGKSIKTDDNSLKFILIDKNSRKSNNTYKDIDSDLDRLQKLRKRMFWSRNNASNTLDSSRPLSSTIGTPTNSVAIAAANTLTKPFSKLKHKSHLFGIKLEKLCAQTNQLPAPLLNLLEKVASEGYNALMVFRKSASAKLKKYYRQKLDANQTVDYKEMNVHVAALLLKEYLRDYPDGIIDYGLYPECLNLLKINDLESKLKAIRCILDKLSYWNYTCLCYFMCLFNYISSNSNINKMDAHNISVCVAPSLFHKLDRPNDVETSLQTISFVRLLIENIEVLFGKETLKLLKAAEFINQQQLENNNEPKQQLASTTTSIASSITTATTTTLNNHELDTDSNDGHNNDSSIDDVIGTSSEIEILDLAHLNKNKNSKLSSLLTQSLMGPAAVLATSSVNAATRGHHHHLKTTSNLLTTSNHHDFSSNTLSVDSGLSVPTATSDPESEKSSESAVTTAKLNELAYKQQMAQLNKQQQHQQPQQPSEQIKKQQQQQQPVTNTQQQQQQQQQQKLRSLSARERDDSELTVTTNQLIDPNDSKFKRICKTDHEGDNDGDYDDDDDDENVVIGTTTTTNTNDSSQATSKLFRKVNNNNTIGNKKYHKKNSTIMKQFSESDVFYDSTSKDDSIKYFNSRNYRHGSNNNESTSEQSLVDCLNSNVKFTLSSPKNDIKFSSVDNSIDNNITSQVPTNDLTQSQTKSQLSKSAVNLKNYQNNVDEELSKQINKKSQKQVGSSTTTTATTTSTNVNKKDKLNSIATNFNSKRSIIKVNLEKSINQLQTNVIKGISAGLGIANDLISNFHTSPTTPSSSSFNQSQMSSSFDITSPRVASSVYIPQSTVALTNVINVLDSTSQSPDLLTTSTAATATTQPVATTSTTTNTTTRRKVSKTKDDYKPSRQFVENLQATQRNRKHSGTTSSSRSSSRDSDSSSGSDELKAASIKRSSSNCSANEATATSTSGAYIQNNREQYKRSKRTRAKNSILRAKSFNYQTTSSPIEQLANKQPTNPNLTASIYTSTTNNPNSPNSSSNLFDPLIRRNIRRSVSLKHYKNDPNSIVDKAVEKLNNNPNQNKQTPSATSNINTTPIIVNSNNKQTILMTNNNKNDNRVEITQQKVTTNPVTKIVTHTNNISKVDTNDINVTNDNNKLKAPERRTSLTSFVDIKSKQTEPLLPNSSQYISKVYTSNYKPTSNNALSRSTNLHDYRPLSAYNTISTSKSITNLSNSNIYKDSFNNNTLGSNNITTQSTRLSIGANIDSKSLSELKSVNTQQQQQQATGVNNSVDQNLVNVTWSVSNIRKQFEQTKFDDQIKQQLIQTPPSARKSIQSISSIFQLEPQQQQQQQLKLGTPQIKARANSTNSTEQMTANYLSTVKINRTKNTVYKDIYGNPTTYI